jgi:hypothetical protein
MQLVDAAHGLRHGARQRHRAAGRVQRAAGDGRRVRAAAERHADRADRAAAAGAVLVGHAPVDRVGDDRVVGVGEHDQRVEVRARRIAAHDRGRARAVVAVVEDLAVDRRAGRAVVVAALDDAVGQRRRAAQLGVQQVEVRVDHRDADARAGVALARGRRRAGHRATFRREEPVEVVVPDELDVVALRESDHRVTGRDLGHEHVLVLERVDETHLGQGHGIGGALEGLEEEALAPGHPGAHDGDGIARGRALERRILVRLHQFDDHAQVEAHALALAHDSRRGQLVHGRLQARIDALVDRGALRLQHRARGQGNQGEHSRNEAASSRKDFHGLTPSLRGKKIGCTRRTSHETSCPAATERDRRTPRG